MTNLGVPEIIITVGLCIFFVFTVQRFLIAFRQRIQQSNRRGWASVDDEAEKPKRDFYTLVDDDELSSAENLESDAIDDTENKKYQ